MDNNNTLLGTVLLCILFSIIGCKRDGRIGTMLAKCEEIATQAPDSILSVLDSLDKEETFKSKSDKMRFYLIKLRIQNNTDRPFMGTDTIENVSDYYSKKGSPRDRLYARYLLARAYLESQTYDKAYTAFQKCLADTVCTDDKEYNTLLSKVHIQFAKVYQARYMTDNEIEEMHKAIYMARKTGDEDLVINCRSHLFHPYIIKNDHDKVIGILNETCSIMRAKGQNRLAAQYQTALLSSYLKKEDYAHAKECIETFEKEVWPL